MIWVDYCILGIIAGSALISLVRGFVREALSLLGWILALWAALAFTPGFSAFLSSYIDTPKIRDTLAFVTLLVGVVLLFALVNLLAGKLIKKYKLSGTDRIIGVFFGIGRGCLMVSALMLLGALLSYTTEPWWRQSLLLDYFQQLAIWLRVFLPPNIATAIQMH